MALARPGPFRCAMGYITMLPVAWVLPGSRCIFFVAPKSVSRPGGQPNGRHFVHAWMGGRGDRVGGVRVGVLSLLLWAAAWCVVGCVAFQGFVGRGVAGGDGAGVH